MIHAEVTSMAKFKPCMPPSLPCCPVCFCMHGETRLGVQAMNNFGELDGKIGAMHFATRSAKKSRQRGVPMQTRSLTHLRGF